MNVGDLVTRGDEGTERRKAVQALAARPLPVAVLQIARGHIVHQGVAKNVIESVSFAHASGFASNHHGQLRFIIHRVADCRQRDRRLMRAQAVRKFVEDERRFRRLSAAFDRMINIVAANGEYLSGRNDGKEFDFAQRKRGPL